jgi:hypothetical protein
MPIMAEGQSNVSFLLQRIPFDEGYGARGFPAWGIRVQCYSYYYPYCYSADANRPGQILHANLAGINRIFSLPIMVVAAMVAVMGALVMRGGGSGGCAGNA